MRVVLRVLAAAAVVAAVVLAAVAVLVAAPWLWAVVAACAAGGLGAAVVARRVPATTDGPAVPTADLHGSDGPAAVAAGPVPREVDDLPGFYARPPGSPTAPVTGPPRSPASTTDRPVHPGPGPTPEPAPAEPTAPDPAVPAPASSRPAASRPAAAAPTSPTPISSTPISSTPASSEPQVGLVPGTAVAGTGRSRRRTGVLAAVVVLVLAGGGLAVAVSTSGSTPTSASTSAPPSTTAGGGSASTGTTTASTAPAAPLTAAAAGDLAGVDLPPGDDGFTASLTFPGVVLEPRAVGVTVAYPVLTVDGDGTSTIAHLDLPVWNCLAGTPPADPVTAQCTRALEEHADLGSPDLVVERDDDGADLSGSFATYTRPNGAPPAYTGRSYPVTATITDRAGAAGTVSGALTLGGTRVDATGPGSLSG